MQNESWEWDDTISPLVLCILTVETASHREATEDQRTRGNRVASGRFSGPPVLWYLCVKRFAEPVERTVNRRKWYDRSTVLGSTSARADPV